MSIQKSWLAAGAVLAALAMAAGCDGAADGSGADADGPRNVAAARGVPPDVATATTVDWPEEAAGGDALAADLEDGRQLYLGSCAACHGTGGQGLPNQGPDLRGSAFVADASDETLRGFLAAGRPVGDPKNTSGLPMPPRGGNPSLSDRHLGLIVTYLRSIEPRQDAHVIGLAAEQGDSEERS